MTSHEHSKPKARARQKRGAKASVQEQADGLPPLPDSSSEPEWHERAAFHVTFDSAEDPWGNLLWQTRAYHEESDSRALWSGAPGEEMIRWICEKAELTSAASPRTSPADLQLIIGELRLDEALVEPQIGEQGGVKRLRAGVEFQLTSPIASSTSAQASGYVTQILAYTPATGATTILATDQQQLRQETLAYTAELEFDVPETGAYQLLAIVLLPDDGAVGITLGPMLSVIP